MATFRKRGKRWQALVKIDQQQRSKTFDTKVAAVKWAVQQEKGVAETATLRDAFLRYRAEVSPRKRGRRWEQIRIDRFLRTWDVVDQPLASIRSADITAWRDARLQEIAPSSVSREMTLLSHVFRVAAREWNWIEASPVSQVTRPQKPQARTRVIQDSEIPLLLTALGWQEASPQSSSQMTAWALLFALETAMRSSEILGLQWEHVRQKTVHLPMTKNGTSRDVPLTLRARELIKLVHGLHPDKVLPLAKETRDVLFRRAVKNAGLENLHFHDARRTGTIRLSRKLEPMELAKVTGHRDLRMLLNVYYGVVADDLADRIG